ncbi:MULTISPECIES: lamin tail domain-containing protein [unclassified Haladaptatus]|uniref:lamin tail domain-containing protein n=1 Tax=unclassified Haladaptatus TaxID=2622732 RepID=UPI00209C0FE2|nr:MULTISPECIES: lamin tail domain-containing protein [unclassified Haladaptatus]MCO8245408.1 lamin tail domain-containing protein [Haladaptatus sp. AB643]MCO8256841.1 lamin tail domain-containing protein [Haladaptatus sp. AB618]
MTEAGNPGAQLTSEQPEEEPIVITDIRSNQDGDLNNEYATLKNDGDLNIDMTDFILSFEDGRGQNYTFGDFTLGTGESVTVRNGSGEDTQSTLYTGWNLAVLNNSHPDTVVTANDENNIFDEKSYQPA